MSKAVRIRHGPFGRIALLDFDRPLIRHAHSQAHLLIKVGGADTRFGIGERVYPLTADRGVYVHTWQLHHYPHADLGKHAIILAIYLESSWLAARWPRAGFCAVDNALQITPQSRELIDQLHFELLDVESIHFSVLEQMLAQLIAALTPADRERRGRATFNTIDEDGLDRRIRKAVGYMRGHVGDRIDLGRLALQAGLSRQHMFELFQREVQLTPGVFWNMLRMESALDQLCDRRVPVGTVSANLGFTAQSNFTRFFRDIQGIGPKEYRNVVGIARD